MFAEVKKPLLFLLGFKEVQKGGVTIYKDCAQELYETRSHSFFHRS